MFVISKRASRKQDEALESGYLIIDVTSSSRDATFRKFSPFYPHGKIPVPGINNAYSESVEGVFQGLKVFSNEGLDVTKFAIKSMKNIKRTANEKRGRIIGHKYGAEILNYEKARECIYIPTYHYMLETYMQNELALLRGLLDEGEKIAFLDYTTNADAKNTKAPLSHAALIINYLKKRPLFMSSSLDIERFTS